MKVDRASSNQTQGTESGNVRKTAKAAAAEQAKKAKGASADSVASGGSSGANVEISAGARDAAAAKAVAGNAPDVREAKVAELRRRIAEGKYNVDNDAIADRMVDEHLSMAGMS